ncbi:hypothetical protein [Neisseria chenwenguii]|uniref:hypothetical protein n=1 Tax=Neisseria chenwenguii TaxID=1853278 RepID=UPI0018F668BF|nr:hypothetical protein [Neisseria chenwenguii]
MSKIKNKNKNACLKTESHGADRLTRDCCFRSPESMQIFRVLLRNLTQHPTRNTACNHAAGNILRDHAARRNHHSKHKSAATRSAANSGL